MRLSLQALGLSSAPMPPHGGPSLPLFQLLFFPTLFFTPCWKPDSAASKRSKKKSTKCWEMSVWLRDLLDQQGVRNRNKRCLYVCSLGLTPVMIKRVYFSSRLNRTTVRCILNSLLKLIQK